MAPVDSAASINSHIVSEHLVAQAIAPSTPSRRSLSTDSGSVSLRILPQTTEWTPKLEREFLKRAAKYALGTLNPAEVGAFEELERLRNLHMNPRSPDEIHAEIRLASRLGRMESLLRQHVAFFEDSNQKRATSKEAD